MSQGPKDPERDSENEELRYLEIEEDDLNDEDLIRYQKPLPE